jgi:predicted O-methyltransferase YrrM
MSTPMYLDSLSLLKTEVGYGGLGLNGDLGYEGRKVSIQGRRYQHAISAHPPARLLVRLDGAFTGFRCHVAINDDVPAGASHADFAVLVNGQEVAVAPYVRAGEPPRELIADVSAAEQLELVVRTSHWEYSHAVWIDPLVEKESIGTISRTVFDCLGRAAITAPAVAPRAERCIASVISPGFERMMDDMLGSLYANGRCQDALLVVFALNSNEACESVVAKYGGVLIRCDSRAHVNPMSKALLYSAARVIDAEQFLFLDADMLVLRDLRPVFSAIEACPPGSIMACREGNNGGFNNLGHAIRLVYGGCEADCQRLGLTAEEAAYSLVVNDGIFAGGRSALLALDGVIRAMPQAATWVDEKRNNIWWRNQFVFNVALARLRCGVELDPSYNVQLHSQDVQLREDPVRVEAEWHGRPVRVLHFSGGAKSKYPAWQGRFARVPDPLVGWGGGDAYGAFLAALRAWIGCYGTSAMAWSFYGLTNAKGACIRDASTFPLMATLHYLIRANGCVRVLESGTARGVSAACLASAVAHRDGGRVVTLDPYGQVGREELWAMLPDAFRRCIEARPVDALGGMKAALEAGERYDAILLDSIHTEEHVWAEFQLAAQLVCAGGLILIHDPWFVEGTVEGALRRIAQEGYSVVRLWTAEAGVPEDDHLGLALIENRRYTLPEQQ